MANKKLYEAMKNIPEINAEINKIEDKGLNVKLEEKEPANRAKFSQIILENIQCICNKHPDYLSNSEFALLFKLCSLTTKIFNVISVYEKRTGYGYKNTAQAATITQIAEFINKSRSNISKKINSLIEKGIIYEDKEKCIISKDERKVNATPLFINPEISYQGSRNRIVGNLARLIKENNILEKNDINLPWKVWINHNANFGKLVRRETFIKKKREEKA